MKKFRFFDPLLCNTVTFWAVDRRDARWQAKLILNVNIFDRIPKGIKIEEVTS